MLRDELILIYKKDIDYCGFLVVALLLKTFNLCALIKTFIMPNILYLYTL
jgi:hypothetical protein